MAAPSRPPFLFLIPILTAIFLYYWNVTGQQQVLEAYLVTDLPGRGKGLIATRNISVSRILLRLELVLNYYCLCAARRTDPSRQAIVCLPSLQYVNFV